MDKEYFKAAIESLRIIYPEVSVKFDAKLDAGLYVLNVNEPYIHITIDSPTWKKGDYKRSKELKDPIVVLDYDNEDNLIGVEVIGDCELGDLKE